MLETDRHCLCFSLSLSLSLPPLRPRTLGCLLPNLTPILRPKQVMLLWQQLPFRISWYLRSRTGMQFLKWRRGQPAALAREHTPLQITPRMRMTRHPVKWIEPLYTFWILLWSPLKGLYKISCKGKSWLEVMYCSFLPTFLWWNTGHPRFIAIISMLLVEKELNLERVFGFFCAIAEGKGG